MGKTMSSSLILLSIIITLIIMAICCLAQNNNVTFDCIASEKNALMRFKASFSVDPSNYNRLSSWKNNSECCSWEGVECDNATRYVVGLHLKTPDNNRLRSDRIDSSLLELKYLNYLDLSRNDFNGSSIPTFLGSMKQLQHLNLSHANFSGTVPHQLGNLLSLRELDLGRGVYFEDHHLIADDVTWAGNLLALEYLDLSGIDISGTKDVVKVLTLLPSLVNLRLSNTGLANTNLPHVNCLNRSTLLFTKVQHLDLSFNRFGENSSFCFLHNMTSLKSLNLSRNSIHQNVDWISDLLWDKCHLKSLYLKNNRLYGDISVVFRNLSDGWGRNLESINLRDNEFYGNLTGLFPSSLSRLKVLDLRSNQLGGEIPVSLGQLSSLERIFIFNNSFQGTLSEAHFDKISRLEYLIIGFNSMLKFRVRDDWVPPFHQLKHLQMESIKIEGQFPQWIQTQMSLQELDLRNCSIRGKLPAWLGYLKNLTYLHLSDNHIEGTLPGWLGSLMNLSHLHLSNNHIEGPIPELPSSLRFLFMSQNFINGSIPESLCRMKDLCYLDLSRNHLSGNLSGCDWGNFDSLNYASFSYNQLSGPIPNYIGGGARCSLQWLQLNSNSFTGQIPFTLKNCRQLYVLDVGDNELSGGKLPEWIGNHMFKLAVLKLRNNKFYGNIPSSYCQMSLLQVMDLAHNQLTGHIPKCLGNLSGMVNVGGFSPVSDGWSLSEEMKGAMMEYTATILKFLVNLDLSSNHLFGEIPSELMALIGLNGLNLSHNHLGGKIHENLGDMKSLESLDLSNNHLSGVIPQSLSKLTSLSHLNLSNNDLLGPIPTGPQLQTFNDPSAYEGNPGLCGPPLPKKCHILELKTRKVENDQDGGMKDKIYMFAFIISGIATGFWGYFGVLVLKRSWRVALFRRMDVVIGKMLGRN